MMRFIIPTILIIISVAVFFVLSNPFYNDIGVLGTQLASRNEALDNSKAFGNEENKLTEKYNAIDSDDLAKIQKLLPNNVDNIRLILEIGKVAEPYGMVLKDIKYNATTTDTTNTSGGGAPVIQGGGAVHPSTQDYGVWDLEFSTVGTYDNFLNFTRDLEKNLRIVDISSIQFSSNATSGSKSASASSTPESYKYGFKIKTYWLKN